MIHISRTSELVQTQAFWVIIESDLWKHMQYFNGFVIIQAINTGLDHETIPVTKEV